MQIGETRQIDTYIDHIACAIQFIEMAQARIDSIYEKACEACDLEASGTALAESTVLETVLMTLRHHWNEDVL